MSFDDIGPAPAPASVEPVGSPASVLHRLHVVPIGRKRDALLQLLAENGPQNLVFTRTRHGADKIARFLDKQGIQVTAIHGDKSQGARQRALAAFRDGSVAVLVATDLAARGLDLEGLPLLLNYDLPNSVAEYEARIARCAEQGSVATSLLTQEEAPQFRTLRECFGDRLEMVPLPGLEAPEAFDPDYQPEVRPIAAETPPVPAEAGEETAESKPGGRQRRKPRTAAEKPPATPRPAVAQPRSERPEPGNSLNPARGAAGKRRRGRPDPFAPPAPPSDEDTYNIYDERQPDDYRDQWSVLGPESGRPSWTYAEQPLPQVGEARAVAGTQAAPRGAGRHTKPHGARRHGRRPAPR